MSHDFDPSTIIYAFDKGGLGALRDLIYGAEDVVFDLETSGLHPYKAGEVIVMASFTLPQRDWEPTLDPPSVIVPLWHPDSP